MVSRIGSQWHTRPYLQGCGFIYFYRYYYHRSLLLYYSLYSNVLFFCFFFFKFVETLAAGNIIHESCSKTYSVYIIYKQHIIITAIPVITALLKASSNILIHTIIMTNYACSYALLRRTPPIPSVLATICKSPPLRQQSRSTYGVMSP